MVRQIVSIEHWHLTCGMYMWTLFSVDFVFRTLVCSYENAHLHALKQERRGHYLFSGSWKTYLKMHSTEFRKILPNPRASEGDDSLDPPPPPFHLILNAFISKTATGQTDVVMCSVANGVLQSLGVYQDRKT